MQIQGLHHITLVASNAQQTVNFYVGVLGLRLVKQTVNFDDPGAYHLYFGDDTGSPGTLLTFFEWPQAPTGKRGIGGTHHVALQVADYDGLLKWKRRLQDLNITVNGPYDRHYFKSIYFKDPDGLILEIATHGPGFLVDEDAATLGEAHRPPPQEMMVRNRDEDAIAAEIWPEPVPMITPAMTLKTGMHHITAIGSDIQATDAFYRDVLQLQRVKKTDNFDDPDSAHWYWGVNNGEPGSLITYFERDPQHVRRAKIGHGLTHHFAFSVANTDEQTQWRKRLMAAGYRVSQILDRDYFQSIYTSDPDGHIVELATAGPGFLKDEDKAALGQALQLPRWLAKHRKRIESQLTPLTIPQQKVSE